MSLIDRLLDLFGLERKQPPHQEGGPERDPMRDKETAAFDDLRLALREKSVATLKSVTEKIREGREAEFTPEEREAFRIYAQVMSPDKSTLPPDDFKQALLNALEQHGKEDQGDNKPEDQ
jgi:hypothetical protein